MAKTITYEAAKVRAEHLRKQGIQNAALARKQQESSKRMHNDEGYGMSYTSFILLFLKKYDIINYKD